MKFAIALLAATLCISQGKDDMKVKAAELDGGIEWFNADKPVTLAELKGHFVLLDFWTYC